MPIEPLNQCEKDDVTETTPDSISSNNNFGFGIDFIYFGLFSLQTNGFFFRQCVLFVALLFLEIGGEGVY